MKRVLNILFACLVVAYPFAVFFGLMKFEPRVVSLLILIILMTRLLMLRSISGKAARTIALASLVAGLLILVAVQIFNKDILVKMYPVAMNLAMLLSFGYTLRHPPSMIERFARTMKPDLPDEAIGYLKKVTGIWCAFFVINGSVSAYTAFACSTKTWTLYNGLISYILIGTLFLGEIIVRQFVRRKGEK